MIGEALVPLFIIDKYYQYSIYLKTKMIILVIKLIIIKEKNCV